MVRPVPAIHHRRSRNWRLPRRRGRWGRSCATDPGVRWPSASPRGLATMAVIVIGLATACAGLHSGETFGYSAHVIVYIKHFDRRNPDDAPQLPLDRKSVA